MSALAATLCTRVLQVAPGDVDLASAGASTAFNVGITLGALLGSVLLAHAVARGTPLAGAILTLAGLAVLLSDRVRPALSVDRRRAPGTAQTPMPGRHLSAPARHR